MLHNWNSEILPSYTNTQPGTTWNKNLSEYTTAQSGISDNILSNIQWYRMAGIRFFPYRVRWRSYSGSGNVVTRKDCLTLTISLVYENVLFEHKKIKLWNKWHFVENKTEIIQHVLKMQHIYLLPKYIKWISRGVFNMCVYVKAGCLNGSYDVQYSRKLALLEPWKPGCDSFTTQVLS